MCGENSDGSVFTTGCPDFKRTTEYSYESRSSPTTTLFCLGSSMDPQWK